MTKSYIDDQQSSNSRTWDASMRLRCQDSSGVLDIALVVHAGSGSTIGTLRPLAASRDDPRCPERKALAIGIQGTHLGSAEELRFLVEDMVQLAKLYIFHKKYVHIHRPLVRQLSQSKADRLTTQKRRTMNGQVYAFSHFI